MLNTSTGVENSRHGQRLEKYRHSYAQLVPNVARTSNSVKKVQLHRVPLASDHDYFKPELNGNVSNENVLTLPDVNIEDAVEEVVTSDSEVNETRPDTFENVDMLSNCKEEATTAIVTSDSEVNETLPDTFENVDMLSNCKEEAITAIVDDIENFESRTSDLTSLYENSVDLFQIRDELDDENFGPVINPCDFFDLKLPDAETQLDLGILPDMATLEDMTKLEDDDLLLSSKNSICSEDKGYESIGSPLSDSSINEFILNDPFLFPDLSLDEF